ncbi:TSC22 domain family protein 1-like isoform X2 [Thalassophryne amazonica]|uniref:TSC22 domain family protein 1-like isoform X2 n=1 Tax=Thalassophryne amazonica TaxID=390379 RepID=UPI0014719340|nr:TSC22 domain family protein 1-like isoform X2 [Thalassophryne amazonica]
MHHQDCSGGPPGTGSRKSTFHYRRGNSGVPALSSAAAGGVNTVDESTAPAGSSPGLQHQPQTQAAGAQVKKKSGFQITSVTSAQISVSGNNSLADDTESYDDLDESHTEDLSSSDMLDVSVPRATDTAVPERSSSDETLNSLHGVDTPGIVSPNEPLHSHPNLQVSQQNTSMVNGVVHHHYPQQHSQPLYHHSDSFGGVEPSLPDLPIALLATSSPALASKGGVSQSRPTVVESTKPAGGKIQPLVIDTHLQGNAAAGLLPSGPLGFDHAGVSAHTASAGVGTALSATSHHTHTQTGTGSRFRVVKLDTYSEPFRKGRWTCTEYYEKELPHSATSEAVKSADVILETETGNAVTSPGVLAVQPPHTLQPPSQDFTTPQTMQSSPQGLAHTLSAPYVAPQDVVGGAHMQKSLAPITLATGTTQVTQQGSVSQPLSTVHQQLLYAVDPHQSQAQGGYPASQVHVEAVGHGSIRQPDFIQPTAPFQTQVQHTLQHITTGMSRAMGPLGTTQPPVTPQLPHQVHVAPPAQAPFPSGQAQPPSTVPVALALGTPYMPLTALQADLQPLLTPSTILTQVSGGGSSIKASQLEDAQKLLLQHQGLLGLPRLGVAAAGERAAEASSTIGTFSHMGMSPEASAFMAAAGLRTQPAEGEEDSSPGAPGGSARCGALW